MSTMCGQFQGYALTNSTGGARYDGHFSIQ
jgi:hypothetical protein